MTMHRNLRWAWMILSVTVALVVADQTESGWWTLAAVLVFNLAVFLGGAYVISEWDEER